MPRTREMKQPGPSKIESVEHGLLGTPLDRLWPSTRDFV
jgi:hypothetical protein